MKDIQSQADSRRINIKKVGVKTVSYPVTVQDRARKKQNTIATVNMYVNLPHKFKGTHMSRFVEILNEFHGEINIHSFHSMLEKMKSRLEAEASHLEIQFPYFLEKTKNGGGSVLGNYDCAMHGSLKTKDDLTLKVIVPISLPVTERNHHGLPGSFGKWGDICVRVKLRQFFWIEDLILLMEDAVHGELEGMAKQDATFLSVENLSRRAADILEPIEAIRSFSVTVRNFGDGCSTFATVESETVD